MCGPSASVAELASRWNSLAVSVELRSLTERAQELAHNHTNNRRCPPHNDHGRVKVKPEQAYLVVFRQALLGWWRVVTCPIFDTAG